MMLHDVDLRAWGFVVACGLQLQCLINCGRMEEIPGSGELARVRART